MVGPFPELTLREKVLLWLAHVGRTGGDAAERTQAGLAHATGLDRGHVSRTVAPLVEQGLLVEERARVPGFARALKGYALSPQGKAEAELVEAAVLAAEVDVRRGASEAVRLSVKDALARLPASAGLWGLVQQVGEHGFVELEARPASVPARAKFVRDMADVTVDAAFVGRDKESAQVTDWLASPGTLFVVEGPGGVGKTTLIGRALRRAELKRHVLWVRVSEWTTVESVAERVDALLRDVGRQPAGPLDGTDPERAAEDLVRRLKGLPMVLVIDDHQKATPMLKRTVAALLRRTRAMGTLKVALIGREVDIPSDLAREADRRRLHPLADEDADRLLAGLGVGPAERAALVEAAQGNPLFLELLARSGDARRSEAATRADFLHFVTQDLVRDLPKDHVDVLGWASALRAPAAESLFRRLGVGSPATLASLEQASLLKRRDDGCYEMHDLVRQALYDRLSFAERQRIHDALAQAFRPIGPDPARGDWSGVTEFLHHLVRAGRRDEAVRWVLRNQTPLMARAQALFRPDGNRAAADRAST